MQSSAFGLATVFLAIILANVYHGITGTQAATTPSPSTSLPFSFDKWTSVSDVTVPTYQRGFPCVVKRGRRELLLGGVSNLVKQAGDNYYPAGTRIFSSLDSELWKNGWYSANASLFLPIAGQGSCTADDEGNVYISNAGGNIGATAEFHLYPYNLIYKLPRNATKWAGLHEMPPQTRTRASIVKAKAGLFIFGGLVKGGTDDGAELYSMSRYSESINNGTWETKIASLPPPPPNTFRGYCDCVPFARKDFIYSMCSQCAGEATATMHFFQLVRYDATKLTFEAMFPGGFSVPKSTYVSFSCEMIGQYLVTMIATTAGTDMYFFDTYLGKQYQFNTADNGDKKMYLGPGDGITRYAGSLFSRGPTLVYVGGAVIDTKGPNPTVGTQCSTTSVDRIQVYPDIQLEFNSGDYTITPGSIVTFVPSIVGDTGASAATKAAMKQPLALRFSSSMDCTNDVSGTYPIFLLDDSFTWIAPAHEIDSAYLCLSMGVCAKNANERKACSGAPTATDFHSCLKAGCCWDDDASLGNPKCFSYSVQTNSSRTQYYFNADVRPIQVQNPVAKTTKPSFFQTTAGVVTICVIAGVVVVAAVVLIAYFQRRKPKIEHPLENNAKYRLISKVGEGGFGTVFLVEQKGGPTVSKDRYAMKYIACQTEEDRGFAMKEFELIRNAQGHPNMIKLIDMFMSWGDDENEGGDGEMNSPFTGSSINNGMKEFEKANKKLEKRRNKGKEEEAPDGSPTKGPMADERKALLSLAPKYVCIVMDYFPDGDLSSYIRRHARSGMSEHFILHVMCRQVCDLLRHLHGLQPPIVHRDLKPENILLADNLNRVVVTDFGLASEQEKSYMTTRAGSLHYVAPECWKRKYGRSVDMWGLGCIMYASATGRVTADTARVMFSDAKERGFEKDIRYDLRKYSPQFQDIVMGFLVVDPLKRMTPEKALELLDGWNP